MRKIIFLTLLVLSTLACGLVGIPTKTPTEFAQVVYAYERNSNGGADFGFLAQKIQDGASISFDNGKFPTVNQILSQNVGSPLADLSITVKNEHGQGSSGGTTDANGHLGFSTTFPQGIAIIGDSWQCEPVAQWHDENSQGLDSIGGALWQCQR